LGKTLRERAAEKAMIIKPASRVVTAPQRKVVSEIIDDRCRKFGIVPIRAQIPRALPARFEEPGRETFHIETARRIYRNLKCPLLGKHQVENASVAIHAAEALEGRFPLRRKAFYAGLRNVHWPGRIEIVNRNPIIILDSAQDKDSFKALFRTLTERFIYRRLILIIGLSRDKDVAAIARVSRGIFEGVAVKTAHPRAMTAEKIKDAFGKNTGKNIYLKPTPEEGLRMALKKATKEDMIVIAGSIYLLCEIKPAIDRLIHGSPDKQD